MAFPQTVQDIKTELELDGVWTNITSKVRHDPGITITRGRADQSKNVDPSQCTLSLNNTDGRFSPRNPAGIYFGVIGRNTPIRVSILSDKSWMPLDANTGELVQKFASTPDVAALDILTDIELRFEADLDSWYDPLELMGKWTSTGNQRSYQLYVFTTGLLVFKTSVDGVATATTLAVATETLPTLYGHQAVRVTFDANNGAGGRTTTFYTGATVAGPWTQLGAPVVEAGTTTIFSSSAPAYVGPNDANTQIQTITRGRIYAAQFYNSAGTLVANPDFTAQADGATSFADSTGKTWTLTNTTISARDIRFRGEVSSWPQKWDRSGSDVYVDIEGAGILRRLGQGQSPVPSPMTRTTSGNADTVAFWPAEDGADATAISGISANTTPMRISGTPSMASDSTWAASLPLPTLNFASFTGIVPAYTPTNNVQAKMFISIPAGGITNNTVIATVNTTGTAAQWDLVYSSGGSLRLNAYDRDGVNIYADGATGFAIDGVPVYVTMQMLDSGADIVAQIIVSNVTTGVNTSSADDTISGYQMGSALKLTINPQKLMDDVAMGQFSIKVDTDFIEADERKAVVAWQGESAGQRIKRLCLENDIPFFQIASVDETVLMGKQGIATVLELLREAAEVDMGILYEPRDQYGLEYRTRKTLNNQPAVITASYSSNQLMEFEPVEDDDATLNDVTVIRRGGGSYRAVDETGPLSVLQPPDGIGIYDTELTLSLYADTQVADQAAWRLHLGTIDEARFPVIGFDTTSPSFLASSALMFSILQLDIGDRLVVSGAPSWMPPDDVQQLAQGFTEYLANFERRIRVNCSPASVWEIARYASATVSGANQYKYSSDGSTVNTAMNTTTTTMSVATPVGPLWTTEAAQCPIDLMVGGERMTATAVSGASSPQSFTVVRSVNGIVKSHSVSEVVTLFRPARYGF